MMHDGSVQWMDDTLHPEVKRIKLLYKTVWELKHKLMVDFACERGAFIDQSQSFNVYMEDPSINKLNSAYFYSWQRGITTCQYYLRIRTKAKAIQFTVDNTMGAAQTHRTTADKGAFDEQVCTSDCMSCGS
jgi:ribonucleoside-diphosphate reductase subunit M1